MGVEAVVAPRPHSLVVNEVGLFEDAQMLRHCGPADRQVRREISYRSWSMPKALQEQTPGRIAYSLELFFYVRIHLP